MNTLALIFPIVFVVGPILLFRMINRPPSIAGFRILAIVALIALLAALAIRSFALDTAEDGKTAWLILAMIWISWISILGISVQWIRREHTSQSVKIWTGLLGAIGTTIPWFGLALAQFLQT